MNIFELAMIKQMGGGSSTGGSNIVVTSDKEFLGWLNDEAVVEPLASASGEIYTTNNDELYIL